MSACTGNLMIDSFLEMRVVKETRQSIMDRFYVQKGVIDCNRCVVGQDLGVLNLVLSKGGGHMLVIEIDRSDKA